MAPGEAAAAQQGRPQVEAHAGDEEETEPKASRRGASESGGHVVSYLI